MIKRLFVGMLLGLLLGGLVAFGLVQGLGVTVFTGGLGTLLAYVSAAIVGALTGLVAGKPIWSQDGKLEAGLKAFFGALLAAAGMFGLQRWAPWVVDLSAIQAGTGPVSQLPATSLPILAAILGAIFELDNTPSKPSSTPARASSAPSPGKRVSAPPPARVPMAAADADGEEDLAPPSRARGRR